MNCKYFFLIWNGRFSTKFLSNVIHFSNFNTLVCINIIIVVIFKPISSLTTLKRIRIYIFLQNVSISLVLQFTELLIYKMERVIGVIAKVIGSGDLLQSIKLTPIFQKSHKEIGVSASFTFQLKDQLFKFKVIQFYFVDSTRAPWHTMTIYLFPSYFITSFWAVFIPTKFHWPVTMKYFSIKL